VAIGINSGSVAIGMRDANSDVIGIGKSREARMGQQLGAHRPLQGSTPKKWTRQVLSPQELAEQYFDLKCLRQMVEMAENSQGQVGRRQNKERLPRASLS
jgi:hypothetical protein